MKKLVIWALLALTPQLLWAQRGGGTSDQRRETAILSECTATSGPCPGEDYQCKVTASQQIWSCTTPSTWTQLADVGGGEANGLVCTDCVTLTTETSGNYAAGDAEAGNATGLACSSCVSASEMADEDHGDFTYSSGSANLDTGVVGPTELNEAANYTFTGNDAFQGEVDFQGPVLLDWDGDNSYERAVAHDEDGDNVLEMSDLDALIKTYCPLGTCAEGGFTLEVAGGSWLGPTANINGGDGILLMPDNFTLQCTAGAVLNGCPIAQDASCNEPIVAVEGKDRVRVDGCNLIGGATGGDTLGTSGGIPMGVYIQDDGAGTGSSNVWITNNYVHRTVHTGLYAKNSDGVVFANNIVDEAGTWNNGGAWSQPCVYIFADVNALTMQNFVISNNVLKNCQSNGINFRRNTVDDTIQFGFGVGNIINNVGTGNYCLQLAGGYDVGFYDTVCTGGRGVQLANFSADACSPTCGNGQEFWDDASPSNVNASRNITVDGFDLYDPDGEGTALIELGDYHDSPTFRGVAVYGDDTAGQDCMSIKHPVRSGRIESFSCEKVDDDGFPITGSKSNSDEFVEMQDIRLNDVDDRYMTGNLESIYMDGFHFAGSTTNQGRIRNLSGTTWSDIVWRNGVVDGEDQGGYIWRMQDSGATNITWENIRCLNVEDGYCIDFTGTGACTECSFSNISGETPDSNVTNMSGVLRFTAATSDELHLSNIWCDGTSGSEANCVTGIPASASISVSNVENELATEDTGYQVGGTSGPKWTSGTSTPGTCTQGDMFTDTDGDASSNCCANADCSSSGECTYFVCVATNTWVGYPNNGP